MKLFVFISVILFFHFTKANDIHQFPVTENMQELISILEEGRIPTSNTDGVTVALHEAVKGR